ncbi:MAG TPA: cardiolipin synthase [Candidatus Methylacidiphilales bacterium]|jgi:cardiolipin synthase|nr:cardiolipin synthase [Candidatus Methylacidiphilales bacterium]
MWLGILDVLWVLGLLCIPHLLLLNKRPTATLAWLWAILLFPVVGPALYLMIGSERIKRARIRRRQHFRGQGRFAPGEGATDRGLQAASGADALTPEAQTLLRSLTTITQLPVSTARSLRILRKAPAFYGALKEDIRNARDHVHIETYIWREDEVGREFLELLVAAARRGVTVRVLVDEIGSLGLHESHFEPLIEAGGQFSWCHTLSPLRSRYSFNLRNHRKLQVIDGDIAYVGGMNFGREYMSLDPVDGDWGDVQIRAEGSVVDVLQEIFAEDWFFGTAKDDVRNKSDPPREAAEPSFVQVLRSGPDEEDHPMLRVNLELIASARERLWIGTGYFVPGETMQTALQVASARGVDVRLLVSSRSQHPLLVRAGRSYYDALLRQGIRIYEYAKGIEHSKYLVIDREWTSVGSSNLDERSLRLNFELNLLARCRRINAEMAGIFEATIAEAELIDREAFARRPVLERLTESALRPLSPVL